MAELRYSINITVDGCCDHLAIDPDEELHAHHAENLRQADGLLFGRRTYQLMKSAWRQPTVTPETDAADAETQTDIDVFAEVIDKAKKYVVSSTLTEVDWNAELLGSDLRSEIERIKDDSVRGLLVGGVTLPRALAELGLIDEYEFVVHPRIAGYGPYVFNGLAEVVDLVPTDRRELESGAAVLHYRPRH
ncbi:dihydrofolate reductase family protein [Brevibacterium casei]|uniref:dihydrofolate reductase family protein n=1 Tax=Brevibacterium casei TaxID=33889 RepID=UPI002469047A|nr:dihydrofolate reductase family protein [Brevibacterium casei]MDH5147964.1 dihydrofolate reductase family protein [Brevibacterium casei]